MDIILIIAIIIGIVLLLAAFAGCIFPALPGPPLGYLALVVLKLADTSTFSTKFIVIMGLITAAVYFLDYVLPLLGAKIFKASKQGIWFSIIGMLIGMFFFPPFGVILGLLLGAIVGELISGKAKEEALKIGFISFLFSLLSIIIKIIFVSTMAFYFTKSIFQNYV